MTEEKSPATLAGLAPCSRYDLPRYREAINSTRRVCWQHYYPFLYFLGQRPDNRLLIGEDSGSICIYRERFSRHGTELMLFLLPMPFQPEVLERCLQRTREHNRASKVSIFRIDGDDADLFKGRATTRLASCHGDFIYAPASYRELVGGAMGNLRTYANKFGRNPDIEVADYSPDDATDCMAVMDRWAEHQKSKYDKILFHGHTRVCLRQYDRFPRSDLFGKVIRINGEIQSFGFAGEMRSGLGNSFITYSDHRHNGLNTFLNLQLLRAMDGLALVNGSSTGGEAGLEKAKRALGPSFVQPLFQVYTEECRATVFLPPQATSNRLPTPTVTDGGGLRILRLGTEVRQGVMYINEPNALHFDYTKQMMAWLLFCDLDSVSDRHAMQLGLGAASLTKCCRLTLGIRTTAVDLNPAVIACCREHFALPPDDDKLSVIEADALSVVRDPKRHHSIDAVQVDVYNERAAAPLFDFAEFYADCRQLLTRDGILTINHYGRDAVLTTTLQNMAASFGKLALWRFDKLRSGNTVILAQYTPSRPTKKDFRARAKAIESRWGLPATRWLNELRPCHD